MKLLFKQIAMLCILSLATIDSFAVDYREDEPPTLAAPIEKQHDDTTLIASFASLYRAKGKPRIALFWNREQTDVLEQQREKISSTTQKMSNTETEDTVSGNEGAHTLREFDGLNETVTKKTEKEHDDNNRAGLNEIGDIILRSTFRDVLAGASVRFVDRTMMLRTTAAANSSSDTQTTETAGLVEKADWLMELVLVKDKDAPLGYGFRVTVKSIKNSTVLSEFYTQAIPTLPGKQQFIAVPGQGFERTVALQPSVRDIGYNLGLEVIRTLAQTL